MTRASLDADMREREDALVGARQARIARATFDHGRGDAAEAMSQLCGAFHVLRGVPGQDPFDPEHLQAYANGPAGTSGSCAAAAFVLSVWNPNTQWEINRHRAGFDVQEALGCWDRANRAAFVAWAEKPWWP